VEMSENEIKIRSWVDFRPEINENIEFYPGKNFTYAHDNVLKFTENFNKKELKSFIDHLKHIENALYESVECAHESLSYVKKSLRNCEDKLEVMS
jgi:hypothetical protein